jgi:hypothetical protein
LLSSDPFSDPAADKTAAANKHTPAKTFFIRFLRCNYISEEESPYHYWAHFQAAHNRTEYFTEYRNSGTN